MTQTSSYTVSGMTCEHCVAAVTSSLSALDGVGGVSVELVPGGDSTVTIQSAHPLDAQATREAIADAGYDLIGSVRRDGQLITAAPCELGLHDRRAKPDAHPGQSTGAPTSSRRPHSSAPSSEVDL